MAMNRAYIEQMKRLAKLEKTVNKVTPEVYAGIALALHRKHGWGYKRINDLFKETEEIWNDCVHKDINMIEMCEEETGIEVRGTVS